MNPGDVEHDGYVERYLVDRLHDPERWSFELLWFDSDPVFESLRRGLRIRAGFAEREAPSAPAE